MILKREEDIVMGISSEYSDHSSGEESMKDGKKGEQVTYSP